MAGIYRTLPVGRPYRAILSRVSSYADEAAAFLRRRRLTRQPFARVWWSGGRGASYAPETETGRALFLAAAELIDVAGPKPR
ncbi:MAG TPA: hypothetical protein VEK39_06720 [Solirubrobacterales bacterium]|nr:hypothetical protein [Solirubrobacterales bacterium]